MFGKDIKDGTFCPYIKQVCIQKKCVFWNKLVQTNARTGETTETWMCKDQLDIYLLQQISSKLNHNAAAVESMRNQIVKRMDGVPRVTKQ